MNYLRAGWRWLWQPMSDPKLRDFIAVWFLLIQGTVRTIDGALFAVLPTQFMPGPVYGLAQIIIGVWLLATRRHKRRGARVGRWAAAVASGLFAALALDTLTYNMTSAVGAVGIALVLAAEARYVAAD